MYVPKHFEVTDVEVMHDLMRAYPLATLVTHASHELNANHIPLNLIDTSKPFGTLQGHVARSNPLLDDLSNDRESLAIFHGPNAYISPTWYATKQETGKVVPTWNYVVVHAYGKLNVIDNSEWLMDQLERITRNNESQFSKPWSVDDAPKEFTGKLLPSIIGVEMKITKLIGKWKVSQNQPPQNQDSVVVGLNNSHACNGAEMAEIIKNPPKKVI